MPLRRTLQLTESQRHDLLEYRDHHPKPYSVNAVPPSSKSLTVTRPMPSPAPVSSSRATPTPSTAGSTFMNSMVSPASSGSNMVAIAGGDFDAADPRRSELLDRLRQAPGEEARQALAPPLEVPASDALPSDSAPASAPTLTPGPSRWSLRAIQATFPWLRELTLSGVWRVLQRYDIVLRGARLQQYSPDEEYAAKEAHLLACLREAAQHPETIALVFLDEMGYYRWPEAAADWAPKAPAPRPVAQRGGPNNKQWRVVGALNALTGRVDYLENYLVGREQLIRFYRQLDQVYAGVRRLYVAQDNWSIHRHPDVEQALASLPRIVPMWLPTYAPWLNPIEKLWRWLRQDQLYVHRLAHDWASLRQHVNGFLDQFRHGSQALLRYVGLQGEGKLAGALRLT